MQHPGLAKCLYEHLRAGSDGDAGSIAQLKLKARFGVGGQDVAGVDPALFRDDIAGTVALRCRETLDGDNLTQRFRFSGRRDRTAGDE